MVPVLDDRFWSKVTRQPGDGCWLWTGSIADGYGRFSVDGRPKLAHRVSYESAHGPIASDLVLDHLCRNRACVKPDHLEPVSNRTNLLRGKGPSAQHASKTTCPKGHAYSEENTYLYRGMRYCRTCRSPKKANRERVAA